MPPLTSAAWLVWITTLPGIVPAPVPAFTKPPAVFSREAARQAPSAPRTTSGREFFVSWGYNGDAYANR